MKNKDKKNKKEVGNNIFQKTRDDSWESFSERVTAWVGSTTSLIVHTVIFIVSFALIFIGVEAEKVLLVLTTIVSLEAIYLSIFIQMSVNRQADSLEEVEEDIDEIQEDIEEISEEVEEISEEVEEISEDIDEIQEDVEEIHDKEKKNGGTVTLEGIEEVLKRALQDIEKFKKQ